MDTELEDGHCNLKVGLELAIDCGVRVQSDSASLSEHHDFFANLPPVQCQPDSECQSPSQLPALGWEVNEHSDASHHDDDVYTARCKLRSCRTFYANVR